MSGDKYARILALKSLLECWKVGREVPNPLNGDGLDANSAVLHLLSSKKALSAPMQTTTFANHLTHEQPLYPKIKMFVVFYHCAVTLSSARLLHLRNSPWSRASRCG